MSRAYLEHVAIPVRDIGWHLDFFREVLGMGINFEMAPTETAPRQVWTIGGIQLMSVPDFDGPEGRLAHLGIMTDDLEGTLERAKAWGVTELPQGRNWLALPDGLRIEIIQAAGDAVARALSIDPRT
jgi:catechol 2,3-dioxygenase-like lactoylglutathione lyase family enzyme